jgi:hypothetical protein
MERTIKKYEKLGLVKRYVLTDMVMVDIEWQYKFEGGKAERNKLIYLLKKNGYQHQNSYYIKMI